jgi:hypothetical protein
VFGTMDARLEPRESGGCTATADTVRDVTIRGPEPSTPSHKLVVGRTGGVGEVDVDPEPVALPRLLSCKVAVVAAVVVRVVVLQCGVGRRDGCGSAGIVVETASWRASTFF